MPLPAIRVHHSAYNPTGIQLLSSVWSCRHKYPMATPRGVYPGTRPTLQLMTTLHIHNLPHHKALHTQCPRVTHVARFLSQLILVILNHIYSFQPHPSSHSIPSYVASPWDAQHWTLSGTSRSYSHSTDITSLAHHTSITSCRMFSQSYSDGPALICLYPKVQHLSR
jgi:hypothetical protein